MKTRTRLDARRDQLKLLKLERRGLRPLASAALSQSMTKKTKLAAIASFSAMLIALQPAPAAFAKNLGINDQSFSTTVQSFQLATNLCDEIAKLVENNASRDLIFVPLAKLFTLVDIEHSRFAKFAKMQGATLLNVVDDNIDSNEDPGIGSGGGNCPDSSAWLAKIGFADSGDDDGIGSGGGNCPDNSAWLAKIGFADSGNDDGIGSGGGNCPDNRAWLSQLKISERFSSED